MPIVEASLGRAVPWWRKRDIFAMCEELVPSALNGDGSAKLYPGQILYKAKRVSYGLEDYDLFLTIEFHPFAIRMVDLKERIRTLELAIDTILRGQIRTVIYFRPIEGEWSTPDPNKKYSPVSMHMNDAIERAEAKMSSSWLRRLLKQEDREMMANAF